MFSLVQSSIVVIEGRNGADRVISQGSGVAISASTVITNSHVVEAANRVVVRQGSRTWTGVIAAMNPDHDLARVEVRDVPGLKVHSATIRQSDSLAPGERVFAIGAPFGLELTVSEGLVSGLRTHKAEKARLIQTTAAISPGSSGGGLFDQQARLIGITTLTLRPAQNVNFAVPAEWIQDLMSPPHTPQATNVAAAQLASPVLEAPSAPPGLVASDPFDTLTREEKARLHQIVTQIVEERRDASPVEHREFWRIAGRMGNLAPEYMASVRARLAGPALQSIRLYWEDAMETRISRRVTRSAERDAIEKRLSSAGLLEEKDRVKREALLVSIANREEVRWGKVSLVLNEKAIGIILGAIDADEGRLQRLFIPPPR